MIKLYQFPISHYCEKIRWALDHKGLNYKKVNLIPGLHVKKAKNLSSKTHVPILVDKNVILNESSRIIDYLDQNYPNHSLTPIKPELQHQAQEWEQFADDRIGPEVRNLCYYTLLDYPDLIIPYFTSRGPWYGNIFMKFKFPTIRLMMREYMKLTPENIINIQIRLTDAIDRVYSHIENRPYLVGRTFTRADLAVASLLSPLIKHRKYGIDWPEEFPEPLNSQIESIGNKLDWVKNIYQNHR